MVVVDWELWRCRLLKEDDLSQYDGLSGDACPSVIDIPLSWSSLRSFDGRLLRLGNLKARSCWQRVLTKNSSCDLDQEQGRWAMSGLKDWCRPAFPQPYIRQSIGFARKRRKRAPHFIRSESACSLRISLRLIIRGKSSGPWKGGG